MLAMAVAHAAIRLTPSGGCIYQGRIQDFRKGCLRLKLINNSYDTC